MNKLEKQPFQHKRLRLRDFDYADPHYICFATICARHLVDPFQNTNLAKEVISSLTWSRDHGRFVLYCYCLMPDHLHLAISPGPSGMTLPQSIGAFKRWTTRQSWHYGIQGKLWQRSWYDHIGRRYEDISAICQYILENPVRKGLVQYPEQWPYSGMVDVLPL